MNTISPSIAWSLAYELSVKKIGRKIRAVYTHSVYSNRNGAWYYDVNALSPSKGVRRPVKIADSF